MGSLDGITDIADIAGDLLRIAVGLLKGDLSVLSTEGSLAGIFGSSGDLDLAGSIDGSSTDAGGE
ncbi:hypothetical protein [Corynebacterium kalidii]|uniref:Uncharacterized protein n=1 Tax=Corynebacterium kalidii TaxID=2931982 RepID=A0A9X1WH01_9CORY|nr:hypothetical protein [Corynebacterium kalidii]MCJ7858288.1 hypothetical protein [Corynebacterium kalidii]